MYSDLAADESDLQSQWVVRDSGTQPDSVTLRIRWLTLERLERVASDSSGWEVLYHDPRDLRLWELTFPRSEMHGGGPPELRLVSPDVAREKYHRSVE